MENISLNQAQTNILKLVEQTLQNNEPILITTKKGNAILVSESNWNAIQETLYINSIPGIVQSIIEGGKTPIDECIELKDIEW